MKTDLFDRWLADQSLSDDSIKVYRAMWGKLERYCEERGLELRPDTVEQFLGAHSLSASQCKRYIMLAYRLTNNDEMLKLKDRYRDAQKPLPVAMRPKMGEQIFHGESPGRGNWKHVRDGALLRVMYGAGLKLNEVLTAEVRDFLFEEDIAVVEVRGEKARLAPLIPSVVEYVRAWIEARRKMPVAGELAFPASMAGEPLNPSSVYRMTRKTLEQHGVDRRHMGTGVLRNTFAVRQLENEMPIEAVQDWIGHRRRTSTEPLLKLVTNRHGVLPR